MLWLKNTGCHGYSTGPLLISTGPPAFPAKVRKVSPEGPQKDARRFSPKHLPSPGLRFQTFVAGCAAWHLRFILCLFSSAPAPIFERYARCVQAWPVSGGNAGMKSIDCPENRMFFSGRHDVLWHTPKNMSFPPGHEKFTGF